jgi:hypothetical protein
MLKLIGAQAVMVQRGRGRRLQPIIGRQLSAETLSYPAMQARHQIFLFLGSVDNHFPRNAN